MPKNIFEIVWILFMLIFVIAMGITKYREYKKYKYAKNKEVIYKGAINKSLKIMSIVIGCFLIFTIIISFKEKDIFQVFIFFMLIFMNLFNPVNFVITTEGIGSVDVFNNFVQFIYWEDMNEMHWNKFDKHVLEVKINTTKSIDTSVFIFKKNDLEEINKINEIFGKYYNFK